MSSPLTTALTLLIGATLYAAIHSLFNIYYRPQRRLYFYFALMCLLATGYVLTRLYSIHSQNVESFMLSQRLGFSTAIMLFIAQIGFITEYAQWRPRWVISSLISLLLAALLANTFLPYGLAYSVPTELHPLTLPWGETITDTRIHEKTLWWHLAWLSVVGVFLFQFSAALRVRKLGDTQNGNALLWFGGIFFLVVLFNQLVNYYVVKLTQMGEFGFFAMIVLMSLHLNRDVRSTRQRIESAEVMWSALVMNAPVFVVLVDSNGVIQFINHVMPGTVVEDVVGTRIDSYLPVESRPRMLQSIREAISSKAAVHLQLQLDQPLTNWIDVRLAPLFVGDRLEHVIVIGVDISETIAIRTQLQHSEARYRQLLQTLPYGVQEIDKQGRITFSNQVHDELFGYEPGQMLGMSIYDLPAHQDEVDKLRAYIQHVFESHPVPTTYSKVDRRKNGDAFHVRIDWDYVKDDAGKIVGLISVMTDVTQQHQAQEALRDSADKYRALMERASDIILMADREGRLIEANSRGLSMLGYTREEFTRLNVKDIHPSHQTERILRGFQQLVETGTTTVNDTFLLTRYREELPVDISANLIEYQGDKVAVGFMRDITTRKEREEQSRQHERRHREMLVREVHHRIKNNLQGVIGLLRDSLEKQQGVSKQIMVRAIAQVSTIAMVHGLQASRSKEDIQLCKITRAIVEQSRGLAPADVHVEFHEKITRPAFLQEQEAIPIALAINELITNAVKHIPASTISKQVIVELTGNPSEGMELQVFNSGAILLKGGQTQHDAVAGVGLDLVRALLPKKHTSFSLAEDLQAGGVYARLKFNPGLLSEFPSTEQTTFVDQLLS